MTAITTLAIQGCSRPITARNVTVIVQTPAGPVVIHIEELHFGPAMPPPAGLVFDCTAVDDGVSYHLYTDPATGEQWMRDPNGDYHMNEGDAIVCPPVLPPEDPGFTFTDAAAFSFDDVADTAMVNFTLPAAATALYQSADNMVFGATETVIWAINGDIGITYEGTINEVLGCLWNLGFERVEFNDKIGGITTITWSTEFNSAYIENNLGHRNYVLIPTQVPNQ